MAVQIRPNRLEVTDRFPMLGFTIRTDGSPQRAEIAVATHPSLLRPEHKAERTPTNFFSSRGGGWLPVPRGEAVYVLPPDVLSRFIGQDRLYFAVATVSDSNGQTPRVDLLPDEGSAYVSLRALTGRSLRRVRVVPSRSTRGNGYGSNGPGGCDWAGDGAVLPGAHPTNGKGTTNGNGATNGHGATNGNGGMHAAPSAEYDDGFGPMSDAGVALPPPPGGNGAPNTTAAAAQAMRRRASAKALDLSGLVISSERVAVDPPEVTELGGLAKIAATTALQAFSGPFGPVITLLPAAAQAAGVSIGVGPAVSAGLGAGLGLGAGVIFGPNGEIGLYGSAEFDIGFITSISATGQITIVNGGIDKFNGWGLAAAVSGGEGIVGGGAALFDLEGNFQGVSFNLGVGVGLSPIDFYVAVQRGVSVQLAVAQARAVRQARQVPVVPSGIAKRPARAAARSRSFGDDGPSLDVKLRIFIPSPLIDSPTAVYGGDGRGFSFDQGTSRGEISARVQMTAGGGISGITVLEKHWGESTEYNSGDSVAVPGKPSWWLDKVPGATPTDAATLPATDDNLKVYVGAGGTTRNVLARVENASIFTFEAIGALPLSMVAPDIDADLSVLVRLSGGRVEAKVFGDHDGFPAYEMYVNGQRIYEYDPIAAGNDPTSLIAPMDIAADTPWRDVGAVVMAQSLASDSFTLNWDEVELVAQPTDSSCWAAAAAMVVGWKERISLGADTIGTITQRTTATGLDPSQVGQFANEIGLVPEPPQSYTLDGFRALLEANGPLWVGASVPGLHAIVVTGLYSDGSDTFVRVTDPWDRQVGTPGAPGAYQETHATGSRYILKWEDFVHEYEAAATDYSAVNLQILHSGGNAGRTPNYGSAASAGYAQNVRSRRAPAPPVRARAMSGESFTINWDEVEAIPQPTDVSCWAAAGAMVVGWRDRVSLSPESIGEICHRTTATGLDPAAVEQFANELGLTFEYPACYTVDGFRTLLENNGPLWVAANVPGLHAIVVTGLYSDGNGTFVRITDPWDRQVGTPGAPGAYLKTHATGSRYILSWEDFVREYESAATDFSGVNLQIVHSGGTGGRTANYGSATSAGYAQALRVARAKAAAQARSRPMSRPHARPAASSRYATAKNVGYAGASMPSDLTPSPPPNGSPVPNGAPAPRPPAKRRESGAAEMTRWALDQFDGLRWPAGAVPNGTPAVDHSLALNDWPLVRLAEGDVQLPLTLSWRHRSGAVGDVRVAAGVPLAVAGWSLVVTGNITEGADQNGVASLCVSLRHVFSRAGSSDIIARTDVTILGDGNYQRRDLWEQAAVGAA